MREFIRANVCVVLAVLFATICARQAWLHFVDRAGFSLVEMAVSGSLAFGFAQSASPKQRPLSLVDAVKRHMVTLVSMPILIWLLLLLWREGNDLRLASDADTRLVVLLGSILGFAILVQAGDHLLGRLKKLGPAEFGELEAKTTLPKLDDLVERLSRALTRLDVSDHPSTLSDEERFYFSKASSLVDHLEWSNADFQTNSALQRLVSRIGLIALDQAEYVLAIDRFGILLGKSGGSYQPFEIRYRLALAKCLFGIELLRRTDPDCERGNALLRESIAETEETEKIVRQERSDRIYLPYFVRGQAHEWLKEASHAKHWYQEAAKANPLYAPAVYNAATSHAKVGNLEEAWAQLSTLRRDFEEFGKVALGLSTDPDLENLRRSADYGERVQALVERLQPAIPTTGGQPNLPPPT
jgi:tetratricopeptide (TPR) repeat protein